MGNKITRRRPVVDERFTRPQGLYPHRDVDQRRLRRLIVEAKLAPCFPGAEESATDLEECPICFLHYPSLNRSKCCTKGICTECFLQMKSPHVARPTQCPFCKTPNYDVEYRGAKSLEEKGMEQAEEQKVIEAKIRMRNQEQQDDEERKQRREENIRIRIQQPPRVQPTSNHQRLSAPIDEIDGVNWRSGWGSADRQSPALTTSAPLERIDPFSLWVDEDYQRADAAAPSQQIAASAVSNSSPINHQIDTGFPSPQAPPGATRMRYREDAFDIDLEDIMVMEAIWLSIREQEARHRPSEGEATRSRPSELLTEVNLGAEADDDTAIASPLPPSGLEGEPWDQRIGVAAGGLAGAIAALAEWQAVGGDTTAQSSSSPHAELSNLNHEALNNNNNDSTSNSNNDNNDPNNNESQPSVSGRGELDAEHSSRASEKLANWVNSTQKEYRGSSTWLGDQSSEQVEVGTSFSSSVPSASELPWEAPDNGESSGGAHNDKVLVPESFEQQMILAITLSLADAQTKVVRGGNLSGPLLPQPAHNEASPRQRQGNSRSGPLPRPTYIGL